MCLKLPLFSEECKIENWHFYGKVMLLLSSKLSSNSATIFIVKGNWKSRIYYIPYNDLHQKETIYSCSWHQLAASCLFSEISSFSINETIYKGKE